MFEHVGYEEVRIVLQGLGLLCLAVAGLSGVACVITMAWMERRSK